MSQEGRGHKKAGERAGRSRASKPEHASTSGVQSAARQPRSEQADGTGRPTMQQHQGGRSAGRHAPTSAGVQPGSSGQAPAPAHETHMDQSVYERPRETREEHMPNIDTYARRRLNLFLSTDEDEYMRFLMGVSTPEAEDHQARARRQIADVEEALGWPEQPRRP